MPEPAGVFYSLTYVADGVEDGFPAVNVATELQALHEHLDAAINAEADTISIFKSEQ